MLDAGSLFFFLMIRRPPRSTRTDTLFPYRRASDLLVGGAVPPGTPVRARAVVGLRRSRRSTARPNRRAACGHGWRRAAGAAAGLPQELLAPRHHPHPARAGLARRPA